MRYWSIKNIGRTMFGASFVLGTICLLGFLVTHDSNFATSGFLLLVFALPLNAAVALALLIYGAAVKAARREAMQAILLMLLNIPIGAVYAYIGLNAYRIAL